MVQRRHVLRTISGTLAVAGVGALAGCPGDSGGGDSTPEDTPEPGTGPDYASGLYDPSAVLDASVHGFISYDLATLYERRDLFPGEFASELESWDQQYDAVSVADAERLSAQAYTSRSVEALRGMSGEETPPAGGTALVEGSFQPDAIVQRLEESASPQESIEEIDSVSGYTLYRVETNDSPPVVLALSEDSVGVGATAPAVDTSGESAVRTMIDAQGGGSEYYASSDTMSRLMDALGSGTAVNGIVGNFDPLTEDANFPNQDVEAVLRGIRAIGSRASLNGDELTNKLGAVYGEGDAPDEETVQNAFDWLDDQIQQAESPPITLDDVSVSVNGRVVTASLTRDLQEVLAESESGTTPGGPELIFLLFLFPGAIPFVLGLDA